MAIDSMDSTEAFLAALSKIEMIINTDHFDNKNDSGGKK